MKRMPKTFKNHFRKFNSTLLIGFSIALVVLSGCQDKSSTQAETADVIFVGGQVVTMDFDANSNNSTQYTAVAVKGNKIMALGHDQDIRKLSDKNTQVIELKGKTLMPGIIEGHGHFLSLGQAMQTLDLRDVTGFNDIVLRVGLAAAKVEKDQWVIGWGWHQDKWQKASIGTLYGGMPNNQTMNQVAPNTPVFLNHASGHASYANDAALALAGINDDTPNPAGGTIVRDATGRATGLLRETAADLVQGRYEQYLASLDEKQQDDLYRNQAKLAGEEALRHGVTSFHDAGITFKQIDFLKKLELENALPIRLYAMVRGQTNAELNANLGDYLNLYEDNDFLVVRSIKRQIDGALGSHGAWLLESYTDMPETVGLVLETVKEIEGTAQAAIKHGFQLNTHAIGTRANRETLDIYERIWTEQKISGNDLRWRVEHAQHVVPEDIPRFAQLGVIAAVQGVHCTSDGPWIPTRLGEPRTEITSYRWRDLIDSGARINNGTDVPIESINPFKSIHASIAREMSNGKTFHPAQAMTRIEALKSYTIDNAYSAFEEDVKGSITVGKLADLVVLNTNMMTAEDAEIANTKVFLTMVGGDVVYECKGC